MKYLLLVAALGVAALPVRAINIADYTAAKNNLYSSGFSFPNPVRNASGLFVGAGYDWTGLGWVTDTPGGRVTHLTLISPLHTLSARHNNVNVLGTQTRFVNNANEVIDVGLLGTSTNPIGDLNVAPLSRAITAEEGLTPLRILDVSSRNYIGQEVFMVGSDGPNVGTMVATSTLASQGGTIASASGYSFQLWESGDSGSPALIRYNGELTMAGTAWFAGGGFSSILPTASFDPVTPTNALLAPTGYALKWTVYDNPTDTANTASVWTGGAGDGQLFTGGNWSVPSRVTDSPVVFNTSAGQTALSTNTDGSVRGMLFRETAEGFSFGGSGTLTVGTTGIRNEASAKQAFNVAMKLAGSQNWEANGGEVEFNGDIDNAGYLLAVGGAKDTVISGIISGTGGLAKDDGGTLTLNAVNTYTGATFIHNGTVRLGAGGNLGTGALSFIAGNEAILDLSGRNQTLATITSSFGGTGRVFLGGATLTVNAVGTGTTQYLGSIEGNGAMIKSGAAVWVLGGENTYTGPTQLTGGVLRLASESALSANSNLAFDGGILELAAGDFTRSLGTGAGQVQFSGVGIGGFSAYGGTRVVNLGGTGATVTWGGGGFVPDGTGFRLSSASSDSTLEFQNGIDLGGVHRGFVVNNGSAAIDARITGVISNGHLVKHGPGVLELTANNTYTGNTQVNDGGLLISTPGALGVGNVVYNGGSGVLVLGAGDFTRGLGTGNNQVRFVTGGGFAAYGADRVVNLGGAGGMVTWGEGGFVPSGQNFILSSTPISNAMVEFQNAINLNGADRTIQVGNGTARIDSRISGVISNGGLVLTGAGTLELMAANTYTGQTFINNTSVLLASHASALGSGNLKFGNGGVFMAGAGDFTRTLGTGAGQVQFAGSGGFAAYGADRSINLGGVAATVTWGSGGFVPVGNALQLSTASADATVNFLNPINLAGASRTIQVDNGSAKVDARLGGALLNGGLTKTGAGTLELAVANTYTGATTIDGGALRISHAAALPATGNLVLNGGVLELATGDFTRGLGTGSGQVQFTSSGGFSAYGGNRIVNVGGAKAMLTWASTTGFLGVGHNLILSSESSDSTIDWQNPISLGTAGVGLRGIRVNDGAAAVDAKISGNISSGGSGLGFVKSGLGTLELAGTNTYNGKTMVAAGTLIVSGQLTATSGIAVQEGAQFVYRGAPSLNRSVEVSGGAFLYDSSSAFTGTLDFSSGLVGGSGNLGSMAISVGENRSISPGNSAGTLTTGSQSWLDGGTYLWEIASLAGGAGSGWDLLSIQGNLNILSSTEGFTLRLDSLGSLAGWDADLSQSWTIASVTGAINGFDPGRFVIDSSSFAAENALEGGSFSFQQSGNSLNLVFTAVPEPSITLLFGFSLLLLGRFRRVRRPGN